MELRDVHTFVTVARLLSFVRAGQVLNVVQSTVSTRIAALEEELGLRLLERLGRRVVLTESGERFLEYALRLLDMEAQAREFAAGEGRSQGSLSIKVPESLCATRLGEVVGRFRERFPKVFLSFTSCSYEGLEKELRHGVTDLAFVFADEIRAKDLRVEQVRTERLLVVVASKHRLAGSGPIDPRDLEGETLVLSKADCSYRRMFEAVLRENGVQPAGNMEFSSVAGLKGCLLASGGVSILPEIAVGKELSSGELVSLAWADGDWETSVLMIHHKDKWLSPPLCEFMSLARHCLAPSGA